jgi:cell division protein ZapE
VGGAEVKSDVIEVKGRKVSVPVTANKVARFQFEGLCAQALGAEDYIAIANRYEHVFLENVPQLGSDKRNEAKRFILLIDCLYEAGTILVMSMQTYVEHIYVGHDHEFEFSRTLSRLNEMNSIMYQDKKKRA